MSPYTPYTPPPIDEQARLLSSGTMASLTNKNRYDEVEPIQHDFVEFCEENARYFETWQQAWNEFKKSLPFETPDWK